MPLAWGGGIFGGGGGGGITGSGATGRLALWSSASGLTSDAGLTYSGTGATFRVVTSGVTLQDTTDRLWLSASVGALSIFNSGTTAGAGGAARTAMNYGDFGVGAGRVYGFTPSVNGGYTEDFDTAISRIAAGVVGVGTGASGSVAGTVHATNYRSVSGGTIGFSSSATDPTTPDVSLYRFNANVLAIGNGTAGAWQSGALLAGGGVTTGPIIFTNGTLFDLSLTRRAAATLQLGAADSATPVAQTLAFQGSRGATDTNVAGQDATVQGSLGTGTAASGKLVFKVGTPQGSGTDQHVPATVLTLQDTGTGGTAAPQAIFALGTAGAPALGIGSATTGFWSSTAGAAIDVSVGGTSQAEFSNGNLYLVSSLGINWVEGAIGSATNAGLARLGAASVKVTDGSTGYGSLTTSQYRLSALNTAPSSAADTGTLGEIRIAADYIYICTATNTWVRAALATWP